MAFYEVPRITKYHQETKWFTVPIIRRAAGEAFGSGKGSWGIQGSTSDMGLPRPPCSQSGNRFPMFTLN